MKRLFATFCVAVLEAVETDPSDSDIEAEVSRWAYLFWQLQMPPRTSVVGLIGEIALLDKVRITSNWVCAWHTDPTDNLDFAFDKPPLSVEVKATSSQQRVHEVSIHQVLPTVLQNHYFASVIVELRDSGELLGDVVEEIVERMADRSAIERFWRSLMDVCGSSLAEFLAVRYMRVVARESLQLYRAESIPRPVVGQPLPAGVSQVRFRSDFSSVEPVDWDSVTSQPA